MFCYWVIWLELEIKLLRCLLELFLDQISCDSGPFSGWTYRLTTSLLDFEVLAFLALDFERSSELFNQLFCHLFCALLAMTLKLKNVVFDQQVFFHLGRSYLGLEICKLQSWVVLPALIKAEGSRATASLSDSFRLLEHCLFECL